ncbi:hypothetical protein V1264_015520 [Littorina saxatilis]|uniref:Uncharacterized protein n=1 Tax=Littorina saxatilis TaxID=31220 RepID=A0AAN9BM38_9CAEN
MKTTIILLAALCTLVYLTSGAPAPSFGDLEHADDDTILSQLHDDVTRFDGKAANALNFRQKRSSKNLPEHLIKHVDDHLSFFNAAIQTIRDFLKSVADKLRS